MDMEKVVILTSGGIDSSVLFYWLLDNNYDPYPVYVNYGQCYSNSEFQGLKSTIPQSYINRIQYLDIKPVYRSKTSPPISEIDLWTRSITDDDLRLPYRNLILVSLAAAIAESQNISKIFAGFIKVTQVKGDDCSNLFFCSLNQLLSSYGSAKICLPFIDYSKEKVVEIGISLGVPLHLTYSCLVNSESPCGTCGNCIDRKLAFRKAHIENERKQPR